MMLYIYNNNNLTDVVYKESIDKVEKTALSVVKALCQKELFSYESRIKYTKEHLDIKTKVPIYINEKTLLMPSQSPKRYDNYWINYFEVFSHQKYLDKTLILFTNLKEIELNISYNNFLKMIEKAEMVEEYMLERLLDLGI